MEQQALPPGQPSDVPSVIEMASSEKTRRAPRRVPTERVGRQAWTFSSSGWLFVYFFGVIKCLRKMNLDKYDLCCNCLHGNAVLLNCHSHCL